MKRTIISAAVLTLLVGGVGVSAAEPGPNGSNNRGLCTAYFSGSERGQEQKRKAGPFAELERQADEAGDGNGEATRQEVIDFCNATAPGFGNNGGGGGKGGGRGGGS